MNTILTSQLYDGSYVSAEAFLDEKFILLSPEVPVDQEFIDRLAAWNFDYLLTNGEVGDTPVTSAIASTEDAPLAAIDQGRRDAREMQEAQKVYQKYLGFAEQLFSNFLQSGMLPINPIHERIKSLLEVIKEHKRHILRVPELDGGTANYIVDHAVKTTLVAVATGASMKMPPHRLLDLGAAAMIHEIGMVRLPSSLYMSNRPLTDKEKKAITTHPVLGFKILRQLNYPMQICLAVLECRENVDGSGYPRGIGSDKISMYGKVLNAASTFAAMASPRPYRPAIDGHTIMKTLLTSVNTTYDNAVLQAMLATFSLFPYGTYVRLSSGHRAMVVELVPGKARFPIVRILTDRNGIPVKEQPVKETDGEEYSITGVLDVEEITRLKGRR